jgi:hypothetical protein
LLKWGYIQVVNDLFQLAYVSTSSGEPDDFELAQLLDLCRQANQEHDVTGFLMYVDRHFFQIIEGKKADIDQLYDNIKKDKRHFQITRVLYSPLKTRHFADWSMSFIRYTYTSNVPLKGFNSFLEESLGSEDVSLELTPTKESAAIEEMIKTIPENVLRA